MTSVTGLKSSRQCRDFPYHVTVHDNITSNILICIYISHTLAACLARLQEQATTTTTTRISTSTRQKFVLQSGGGGHGKPNQRMVHRPRSAPRRRRRRVFPSLAFGSSHISLRPASLEMIRNDPVGKLLNSANNAGTPESGSKSGFRRKRLSFLLRAAIVCSV